jgi:hypothetical protein
MKKNTRIAARPITHRRGNSAASDTANLPRLLVFQSGVGEAEFDRLPSDKIRIPVDNWLSIATRSSRNAVKKIGQGAAMATQKRRSNDQQVNESAIVTGASRGNWTVVVAKISRYGFAVAVSYAGTGLKRKVWWMDSGGGGQMAVLQT